MKKKLFLAKISTVFAVFVLCLSIFAFMSLDKGLAWFSKNREVQANGMSAQLKDVDDIVEDWTVYSVDKVLLEGPDDNPYNKYVFKEVKSSPALEPYSQIEPQRQILIKIVLKEPAAVSVKAKTNKSAYPADGDIQSNPNDIGVSAVVEFYAKNDIAATDGSYSFALTEWGNASRFVTFENGELENEELTKSFDSEIELYETAKGGADKEIFLFVDYYEESAEYIRDRLSTEQNSTEENSTEISFGSDITLLIGRLDG